MPLRSDFKFGSEFEKKLNKLKEIIANKANNKIAIALSGGVDSSTLAALCKEWGLDTVAITAKTYFTSKREINNAKNSAEEIGIKHVVIDVDLPQEVLENTPERCYLCKKNMMQKIKLVARDLDYKVVADGTNLDDVKEYRPGFKALRELGIISPWAEAGFTKREIRMIAKKVGLSFYNRPSNSCLATRIPFGVKIKLENLEIVERAEEELIKFFGERKIRVKKIGELAVVKGVPLNEKVKRTLENLGFKCIFVCFC